LVTIIADTALSLPVSRFRILYIYVQDNGQAPLKLDTQSG